MSEPLRIIDFDPAVPEAGDFFLMWDASANAGAGGTRRADAEALADMVAGLLYSEGGKELLPVTNRQNAPGAETLGSRFIVGTAPTGAWIGYADHIAEWDGLQWLFMPPAEGDIVYATAPLATFRHSLGAWKAMPGIALRHNGQSAGAAGLKAGTTNSAPFYLKTDNIDRVGLSSDGVLGYMADASGLFGQLSIPHVQWVQDYVALNGGLGAGIGLTESEGLLDVGGELGEGESINLGFAESASSLYLYSTLDETLSCVFNRGGVSMYHGPKGGVMRISEDDITLRGDDISFDTWLNPGGNYATFQMNANAYSLKAYDAGVLAGWQDINATGVAFGGDTIDITADTSFYLHDADEYKSIYMDSSMLYAYFGNALNADSSRMEFFDTGLFRITSAKTTGQARFSADGPYIEMWKFMSSAQGNPRIIGITSDNMVKFDFPTISAPAGASAYIPVKLNGANYALELKAIS